MSKELAEALEYLRIACTCPTEGCVCSVIKNELASLRLRLEAAERVASNIRIINKLHNLGDAVYDVREREGEGWEGPKVVLYGQAVEGLRLALAALPPDTSSQVSVSLSKSAHGNDLVHQEDTKCPPEDKKAGRVG